MDTYISIAAGVLFSISEILPFLSKIRSNGIVHFLIDTGRTILHSDSSNSYESIPNDETAIDVDNSNSNSKSNIQSPESYELNYIIKYIEREYPKHFLDIHLLSEKTKNALRSADYVVDYDSVNDVYRIKW